MAIETRIRDGVEEHRHDDRDYWHPAARIHNPKHWGIPYKIDLIYEVDDYDILDAISGNQTYYVNILGEYKDLSWTAQNAIKFDTLSVDWAIAISEIYNLETQITFRSGSVSSVRVSSDRNGVEFTHDRVYFDPNTDLHDAKILIETGLASKYIDFPSLEGAMHILHVSEGDRHYDLIKLPSGGHIPVDILEENYGVSWETIAGILLGKPRDDMLFSCPICGSESYFSGACNRCRYETNEDGTLVVSKEDIENVHQEWCARKEREHGEILHLIKSNDWSHCRYIRG